MLRRFVFVNTALIYCLLYSINAKGQPFVANDLCQPLDNPLAISGNFGELRSNTFHAGIDFKTSALVGLNVIAVDDGYVSRIKVDLNGFGRALYINHPNGTTSVYGHLEAFRDDIDKFCKKEQYKLKQFGVDITLKPNEVMVKKGEIIAFAGNRGASSGPHMHFEVRDTRTQFSLNAFKVTNISIPDTTPPVIERLWLYPMGERSSVNNGINPVSYDITTFEGKSKVNALTTIMVSGKVGLGIQVYDMSSNSRNTIGIYSIELFVNDTLVFEQVFDKLSFDQMRYVNSIIDYEHYIKNGIRINRLFVQPNNQLNIYSNLKDRGQISFADTLTKTIRIRVLDDFSNKNEFVFDIKGKGFSTNTIRSKSAKAGLLMHYKTENSFAYDKVKLFIPKDALYDDFLFEYSKLPRQAGYFSEVHHIHNPYTPLHKSGTLSIKPVGLPLSLANKALLVSIDQTGKVIWNGGGYAEGFVTGNIRTFGNYMVAIDTVSPQVQPLFTVVNNDFSNWATMSFAIKDILSGISSYKGLIDDQWALFEYDPKQDLLYYKFDSERMQFGKKHKLYLVVYDEKGNKTEYRTEFYK